MHRASTWIAAVLMGGIMIPQVPIGATSQMWWNFQTQTFDAREVPPTTDAEAVQYIQQWDATQGLYRIYRKQGFSVLESLEKVLRAVIDAAPQSSRE